MYLDKINKLKNGNLLFVYYANNKGRGTDNCTLVVAKSGTTRTPRSHQVNGTIATTRNSSWALDINVSKKVCGLLGIEKSDIL